MAGSTFHRILLAALLLTIVSATAPDPDAAYRGAHEAYDRADWKTTLARIDAALEQFGNRDDDSVYRLHVLRALTLVAVGRNDEAAREASRPLPLRLRNSGDDVDRSRALAMTSYRKSHFKEGLKQIDAARAIARKSAPKLLPQVLLIRAYFRSELPAGEPEKNVRAAIRLAQRYKDPAVESKAVGTLSILLAREERFDEAIDYAERAIEISQNTDVIANTHGNLGWYYRELGDDEQAEAHLRAALATMLQSGAANRVPYLLQVGEIESAHGDLESAERDFRSALDLAREQNNVRGRGDALRDLAELVMKRRDFEGARRLNAEALDAESASKEGDSVQLSRILAGRIAFGAGQLDDARDALQSVLADATSKSIRWDALTVLAKVDAARNDNAAADGHFKEAVETIDEARADIEGPDLRLAFLQVAKELHDSYIEFLVANGRSRDALRVVELNRARTLAEGLGFAHGAHGAFEPQRVAREAKAVVLSYWLAPSRSFVWVVKNSGVEWFALPPAKEIEGAIDSYQKLLMSPRGTIAASGAEGRRLYKMLVEPAASSIHGAKNIVIISDGRLAGFNLEMLVMPDAPQRYWIEDVTIRTAPSLQLLARSRNAKARDRMLLIGNAPQADPAFPPLAYASAEMKRVQQHFNDTTILAGSQATPQAYLASSPESYGFVHFVAHGIATRQRPLESAVILGRDRYGYKLYARDIVKHPLKARLVTISSCHGAGRRSFAGEGLVGLAWAFLRAGSHEVIAALWEVNDKATPEFMDEMYAAIRAGREPADALRAAKLKMLRSNPIYRKPMYWAPFVLYSRS
jgi:CHAT domain-containing protein/Tfp pilus assembly protein PilF